jgi:serine/threonine protein kinase
MELIDQSVCCPCFLFVLSTPRFFQKCVDKDPAKRLTCDQLLAHPFFRNFSFKYPDPADEYDGQKRVRERDRARVSHRKPEHAFAHSHTYMSPRGNGVAFFVDQLTSFMFILSYEARFLCTNCAQSPPSR